jgi:hypothetical protein
MRDSGLNEMYIAATYHSGWFIQPHNADRHTYMTEGSVAYFQPDHKLYKTPMRPQTASFVRTKNWLAMAGEHLEKHQLKMVSWVIGTHNTKLGLMYPEFAQHSVYGESLPHALSIGHDATREYLKGLCRDLSSNYPMSAILMEDFGWIGFPHGHTHERDLTGLAPLEQQLMAICFNPQTVSKGEALGIDVSKVKEVVKGTLDAAFREAPNRPQGHPQTMAELEARSPDLKSYNEFRQKLADSLVAEIKTEVLKGTSCKLLSEEPYQRAIADYCDGFGTYYTYAQPPAKVLEIVKHAVAEIPDSWKGSFYTYIQLGMGIPIDEQQLRDIVLAAKQGGSDGPVFYNYSESPMRMLNWIKSALAGL